MTAQLIIVYLIGIATITWIAREIYRRLRCRENSGCNSCDERDCPHRRDRD